MQIVTTKIPNGKYQNLPTTNDQFWGWIYYQMQIVTTKLPNENIQTYQLQMINSGGGEVNYQMQIVTSFLSLTCEIVLVLDGITIGSSPPPQN